MITVILREPGLFITAEETVKYDRQGVCQGGHGSQMDVLLNPSTGNN